MTMSCDDAGTKPVRRLIEIAKLNGINPQLWLADTLERLAASHRSAALDQLMPWNFATAMT